MKATAKAYTNIALIKYWGKRNETLKLPMNSSLSITLDKFYTTTTVEFSHDFPEDIFIFNNQQVNKNELAKVNGFLQKIRNINGDKIHALVDSTNNFPTAAGFASSASGYAALTAAATKALDLNLDSESLSIIARQGSGSACRSIYGGFVEWNKGERDDGLDSFAKPINSDQKWSLSVLSVQVSSEPKEISSSLGMKRTVETSPFYSGWITSVEPDFLEAKRAIHNGDFETLGKITEANALKMHATTLGASPPFTYWKNSTLEVIQKVQDLRVKGISAYFTIDAGPNVKVLCQSIDERAIFKELVTLSSVENVYICHQGPGIRYLA